MKCNTSRLVPWRSLDHAQNFEATEGNSYKDSTIAGEVEDGSRRLGPSGGSGGDRQQGWLIRVGEEGEPGADGLSWRGTVRYGGGYDGARGMIFLSFVSIVDGRISHLRTVNNTPQASLLLVPSKVWLMFMLTRSCYNVEFPTYTLGTTECSYHDFQ